jgi:gamma-butyrobetaine dioxygenase
LRDFAADESGLMEAVVSSGGDQLEVVWTDGLRRAFPLDWLRRTARGPDPVKQVRRVPWDANARFEPVDYDAVLADDDELYRFLEDFLAYGLAFVTGAPRDRNALVALANRIGTLEPSHLGETFEILVRPDPEHIGGTADAIPLHIDLVYKQTPPRIQMLHALRQVETGGENIFVDALRVVDELDHQDVELLRTTPVWFVAESETVHFRAFHPILTYERDGELAGIHYNEYKVVFPVESGPEVYRAFRRVQGIISQPDLQQAVLLPQDEIVVLDNRRTLHGRRAFSGHERHLVGCFVFDDDLRSRYRTLAARRTTLSN